MKKRRFDNSINAGSMADIAFLLLIFFLVTTTIETELGIKTLLPRWDDEPISTPLPDNNVLSIKLNADNLLMVEKIETDISQLKKITIEFITNPSKSKDKPSTPKNALIAIQNDRSASYGKYILIYNEIKAAYSEIWDEKAKALYGKKFAALKGNQRDAIKNEIPLVISESEF